MPDPRSFRLDEDILKKLTAIGKKEHLSVTWLLERAARKLIEEYHKEGFEAFKWGKKVRQ